MELEEERAKAGGLQEEVSKAPQAVVERLRGEVGRWRTSEAASKDRDARIRSLQEELAEKESALVSQRTKFASIMEKAKSKMQEAVARNDQALALAQAEGLELRNVRDALKLEKEKLRERVRQLEDLLLEEKQVWRRGKSDWS
eukprot:755114-Hanusia_phi.AAC.2